MGFQWWNIKYWWSPSTQLDVLLSWFILRYIWRMHTRASGYVWKPDSSHWNEFCRCGSRKTCSTLGVGFWFTLSHMFFLSLWPQMKVMKVLLAVLILFTLVTVIVLELIHDKKKRKLVIGTLCAVFAVGMYVSPLTVMVRFTRQHSHRISTLSSHLNSIRLLLLKTPYCFFLLCCRGWLFELEVSSTCLSYSPCSTSSMDLFGSAMHSSVAWTSSLLWVPNLLPTPSITSQSRCVLLVIWEHHIRIRYRCKDQSMKLITTLLAVYWWQIPNGLGALSGVAQLSLYAFYRNATPVVRDRDDVEKAKHMKPNTDSVYVQMGQNGHPPQSEANGAHWDPQVHEERHQSSGPFFHRIIHCKKWVV